MFFEFGKKYISYKKSNFLKIEGILKFKKICKYSNFKSALFFSWEVSSFICSLNLSFIFLISSCNPFIILLLSFKAFSNEIILLSFCSNFSNNIFILSVLLNCFLDNITFIILSFEADRKDTKWSIASVSFISDIFIFFSLK